MGLIKAATQAGGIYAIASQGMKTYKRIHQQKQSTPPPQQQQYYQPPAPQSSHPFYDAAGYLYQPWCNGGCPHQCNPAANAPVNDNGQRLIDSSQSDYYDGNFPAIESNASQQQGRGNEKLPAYTVKSRDVDPTW